MTRGCLAIALLCVMTASARAQSIHGFIRDSATNRPIAGVRVVLIRPPNTTLAVAETDRDNLCGIVLFSTDRALGVR